MKKQRKQLQRAYIRVEQFSNRKQQRRALKDARAVFAEACANKKNDLTIFHLVNVDGAIIDTRVPGRVTPSAGFERDWEERKRKREYRETVKSERMSVRRQKLASKRKRGRVAV